MTIKNNITIIITTFCRPHLLNKCLQSLCHQSLFPSQIIVFDNDPQQSAKSIFQKYQKKLPLKYFLEPIRGIPNVRNAAIKIVSTKYIGFIDDDCIFDKNWFSQVISQIKKGHIIFIIGRTLLHNKNNIFAKSQFNYYQQWFIAQVIKQPLPPELFDTKNIIINCDLFKKNKFKFDRIFGNLDTSGFEDTDMGYQFAQKQLFGAYNPQIIVSNQELNTFSQMVKKSYQRGQLKYFFNKKWQISEYYPVNFINKIFIIIKKIIKNKKSVSQITDIILIEIIDTSFKLGYNHARHHPAHIT